MKIVLLLLMIANPLWLTAVSAGPLPPPKGIRHYEIGAAPDFSIADMDGEVFSLASTRGRWVFLHFWASWCGPCREEMPAIQKMSTKIDSDLVEIVLVNTAEDEDTIFSFLGEIGMDMNSLMDADGQVTEKYRPRGLPTTILIDPDGMVQYQAIGGRDWHQQEYLDFLRELASKHQASRMDLYTLISIRECGPVSADACPGHTAGHCCNPSLLRTP